jgi:murein DD-endopeptidase MepM/ murein hydrolase activator NlpD
MPRRLPLSGLVLAAVLVLPPAALAQSGGAAAPAGGGTIYEQATSQHHAATTALRATLFSVAPGSVQIGSHLTIAWRVDGPARRVRARVDLIPTAGGAATHVALGIRPTGRRFSRAFTPRLGHIMPGTYVARLHASAGKVRLVRTARASGRVALTVTAPPPPPPPPAPAPAVGSGRFPVQGAYSFGDAADRFGAARAGHIHQGQDILAASGTPVVTPVPGVVYWNAYQAGGAGYYVVVRGDDGRDYVFMHFLAGSVLVAKGQRVAGGQRLASVGATGDAAGPHLHFEIWPDGWYASKASQPIDPLPDLQAWAAAAP